jgi:uncharacterized protein YjhX (UPF0386 family)
MTGGYRMYHNWFGTSDVADCFVSATSPFEIASSAKILETLFESGLLARIVKEGKVSQITCFDSHGHFHADSSLAHRCSEDIKKLIVYKHSAPQH